MMVASSSPHSFALCFSLFTTIFLVSPLFSFATINEDAYTEHCSSIVPKSSTTVRNNRITQTQLNLQTSYYSGGDALFKSKLLNESYYYVQTTLRFRIKATYATIDDGISKVEGNLYIKSPYRYFQFAAANSSYDGSSYYRDRRSRRRSDMIRFSLSGFWSETSRKLCMVGSASRHDEQGEPINLDAVLKLSYHSENPNIRTGVISGSLMSTNLKNDPGYFDPVSIFDFQYNMDYSYSVVLEEIKESHSAGDVNSHHSLSLQPSEFCQLIGWRHLFLDIENDLDCNKTRLCPPVTGNLPLPPTLYLNPIQCTEYQAKARYLLKFQSTYGYDTYDSQSLDVDSNLIGEASWDERNNELVIVACRILNPSHHFGDAVGDCDVRLRLRFPSVWTIKSNDKALGQLWTNKSSDDPGYFGNINVSNHQNDGFIFPGLKYEYTESNRVQKRCPQKKPAKKGNTYPDRRSYNMRFDISVRGSKDEHLTWGNVVPISVGEELYERGPRAVSLAPSSETLFADMEQITSQVSDISTYKSGPVNISYLITIYGSYALNNTFQSSVDRNGQAEITAEGVYDEQTGHLCAVACRKMMKPNTSIATHHDCEILVSFKFAPLNEKSGGYVKGTIRSTREKSDPLYFKEMSIISNSFYREASQRSIWRMDLEIVLVLISNTLSCIFIALQIFHLRRNPEVKSSISVLMLVILTLGHMIPLVLNFEAMFLSSRDKQTFLLSTGGWLEANEVALRIITMIAFLLQIRLLQLVWNSKTSEESKENSWAGEKKAIAVALPMYVLGGLLTLFLNWLRNKYGNDGRIYRRYSLWGDLRSYAGLILDGFLLPQILLNVFRSCKGKALSYPFYVGTSAIRVVPHAYDQYRMRNYPMVFTNQTYYYANPSVDFYSTAWDVVIPCGIVVFAVLVFLQQRRGDRWILLPRRFREYELYENVPSRAVDHE